MSYPEPRYHGDGGEVTATFRPNDRRPKSSTRTAPDAATSRPARAPAGCSGCIAGRWWPKPGGPAPHFHRTLAESFYVLLGTVRIYDGREWLDATPGDFVHVPIGGIHGFRNDSDAPATMLIHFAPGAPREGYFEGLAEFGRSGRPSDEEMADFYARHDNHWI